MIVVDTNVLSEFMRPDPHHQVARWFHAAQPTTLGITVVSVMEITYGISRLPAGQRKEATARQWRGLQGAWPGHFLTLGTTEAMVAGEVLGSRAAIGRPIAIADAQIAAICLTLGAALSTRNTKEFEGLGIELINPWEQGAPPR